MQHAACNVDFPCLVLLSLIMDLEIITNLHIFVLSRSYKIDLFTVSSSLKVALMVCTCWS